MRGKVQAVPQIISAIRITPAYAGKSSQIPMRILLAKDHPRLCGEKSIAIELVRETLGSPPPMRGKVKNNLASAGSSGITPAYAGKSIAEEIGKINDKDHPRLCGEKSSRC